MGVNIAGVRLTNPVIAASGTYGFGLDYLDYAMPEKLGGIVLKALTRNARKGNPPQRIAETPSGIINSVGLENPGVDFFLREIYPDVLKLNTVAIANIAGASEDEYVYVAERLDQTEIPMLELNVSCPNVKNGGMSFGTNTNILGKLVYMVRKATKKPLIVKLTPNVTNIADIAMAAADAGADALSLINTVAAMAVDAKTRRPIIANITGGLSGPAIKPIALNAVRNVYNAGVKLPIIGMGGIITGEDAAEFLIAGANAVMVGSATLASPWALTDIVDELNRFCEEQKINSVTELTGALITS